MSTTTYARRGHVIFTLDGIKVINVQIFGSINMAKRYNRIKLNGAAQKREWAIPTDLKPKDFTKWKV